MRAIVTVIGRDQVGIIAAVCALLSEHKVNVLDISQTILQEYFTMIMLVDTAKCELPFTELARQLEGAGFLRVQRSYLVHMVYIQRFQYGAVELRDGVRLPVSTKYYAELKQNYLKWKGRTSWKLSWP